MKTHSTTPLAWYQMTREKIRLLLAVAGIAFANILIFMQLGFLQALYDGSTRPHRCIDADIVMVNPRQVTFFSPRGFAKDRLYEIQRYPEVKSISAVRVGSMQWRNPITSATRTILVFGIDPASSSFLLPGLVKNIDSLKMFRRVLFDNSSRPEYGPIKEMLDRTGKFDIELGGKRVKVAGAFDLGASFSADGNVITSDTTFKFLTGKTSNEINLGLIKVKPGTDVHELIKRMRTDLQNDVALYTREQFADVEKEYWANSSGVGFIFGLGVFVGYIVGMVIVYQILHADVADHLAEYATLKAIGFKGSDLTRVLVTEGLLLAVMGFVPGVAVSMALYTVAAWATMMPIVMTLERSTTVFLLCLTMCVTSAVVASRKLRLADPAEIF